MSPEIITIIVLVIALAALAAYLHTRAKSGTPAAPAPAAPAPTEPASRARTLHAADYADSFFSGQLAGVPTYAYKLPAGVRGYGPGGTYDKNCFDPRAFDASAEHLIGNDGAYVDVASLTRHHPDGSTSKVDRMAMRQWLYGLSIDPASVDQTDLLAQGIVTAPRAYLRAGTYTGPGAFGGGA